MAQHQPTHQDIADRLESGNVRFQKIEQKLDEIAELLSILPELQKDVAATKEIVEVWNKGKSTAQALIALGRFIKWIAGVMAAIGAIWLVAKGIPTPPIGDIHRPK